MNSECESCKHRYSALDAYRALVISDACTGSQQTVLLGLSAAMTRY